MTGVINPLELREVNIALGEQGCTVYYGNAYFQYPESTRKAAGIAKSTCIGVFAYDPQQVYYALAYHGVPADVAKRVFVTEYPIGYTTCLNRPTVKYEVVDMPDGSQGVRPVP